MQLHYDHHYSIGLTHQVCQDYVVAGKVPTSFIVLSDGCSSSPNSEMGAKILTLTSQQILKEAEQWPLDYADFGQQLINTALNVTKRLQLPDGVLDATVMLAFLQEDNIVVYVYGDGCLLFKDHNGNVGTIEVVFTHNAPFYLSYWINKERLLEYTKAEAKPLLLIDSVNGQSDPKPFQTPLIFSLPLKKYKFIGIASDGASHFVDINKSEKVPLYDIATDLLAFPDTLNEFVKRHTINVLAQHTKSGIHPFDDLSIGVFVQVPDK
jgi:hypothetical protein